VRDRSIGLWVYGSIGLWVYRSMLFALCSLLIASILYAQEAEEEEGKITNLPPVKIEIVDTMQLNIPKEKFFQFAKPGSAHVYAPLSPKERPWYLPPTSIPEKIWEIPGEAEKDFLFSLGANSGVPAAVTYQMFLVRGFGSSEALLSVERSTLRSERTARLVNDPSKRQGSSTVDKFAGALCIAPAHQSLQDTSLKMDLKYDGKELSFLDVSGKRYPNDRSLTGLSVDWDQKLSEHKTQNRDTSKSLKSLNVERGTTLTTSGLESRVLSLKGNIGLSRLRMEGPLSPGSDSGLDLKTDFGIRVLWPRANPIDTGLGVGYFAGENGAEDFKEAILTLYLRDNDIRIWRFVLGVGMELLLDARKSSSGDWDPDIYPNPCALLMSQIGDKTILQFGVEGYILRQALKAIYLDRDYVRFTPDLDVERTWELNASLQYKLTRKFALTIGAFGKEISNLTVFEETGDEILSWKPSSLRDNVRMFGFSSGWELSLMDGRVKQNFEYIHESSPGLTGGQIEYIPYRPKDKGSLNITYFAPFGLEPSLSGEFYGTRYVDTNGEETLSSYSLLRPRISKTFGRYASVFLAAEIYFGQDDYQLWKGYELPDQIVDFGLTLKF